MNDIIQALRSTKQRLYNNMVNGDSPQPADVVDSVVYAIKEFLPPDIQTRLYPEVLRFFPDYEDHDD
jgi:hypothetical protein